MTLQLLDAEQLRAQQFGIPVVMQHVPDARCRTEFFKHCDLPPD